MLKGFIKLDVENLPEDIIDRTIKWPKYEEFKISDYSTEENPDMPERILDQIISRVRKGEVIYIKKETTNG